jgi:hypothetical protein
LKHDSVGHFSLIFYDTIIVLSRHRCVLNFYTNVIFWLLFSGDNVMSHFPAGIMIINGHSTNLINLLIEVGFYVHDGHFDIGF